MLHLEDKWVWDFWFAQDGEKTHIFYLQAPRSLGNPDLRHKHATIGHAVSRNLVDWKIMPDALYPSEEEDSWDSLSTWSGSILHHNKSWYMFYTGISKVDGLIQRIGLATSQDLLHWTKHQSNPLIKINPQWYELLDKKIWYEQAWRDPWVFEYAGQFHAFITARSNFDQPNERGVIAYARSKDLLNWEVLPPITHHGGFAHMEVPQLQLIKQRWYLIYSVENNKNSAERRAKVGKEISIGTCYMMAKAPFGPFVEPDHSLLTADSKASTYSGKIIQDHSGDWKFITAIQYSPSYEFIGDISDPMPLTINKDGQLDIIRKTAQKP